MNYGVYADALVICEKPVFYDEFKLLLINPLLVVEVLSKSTEGYDRKGKFEEYKTLPIFQEYLPVKQNQFRVESLYREEPGYILFK